MKFYPGELCSTYSIVARDPETGQFGVAVQTHQMSVGRLVPWLIPGIGAVATQSLVNISFGPMALTMLREGVGAAHVIAALAASDENANRRQVAVVDAQGNAAAWTGQGCIAEAAHHVGEGYSVQANMMSNATVVSAMASAFENATGDLAVRMLAALQAAEIEGGDIRGMQSAALVVVPGDKNVQTWQTDYDLRVDEHASPLNELVRLVRLRHAQITDEAGSRALDAGDRDTALDHWTKARREAPELEELPFWQALKLADEHADIQAAAIILRPVMARNPRSAHWIELIRRLQLCGLIVRDNAGDELIAALG
ncbi:MAG: DUF1028 domain-containing protein [Chloroflexota bacterium]